MNAEAKELNLNTINGLESGCITNVAGKIMEDENYGKFQWRARNRWINGAQSETRIQGFFAGGQENSDRNQPFIIGADQPEFLAGSNTAPNAVEYVLHALTSCLTVTLSYHAAVNGILLGAIETSAVGEHDARGFFGISDEVRKGFSSIRVDMRVASQADVETLTELAMFSPVFEMISRALPVEFNLETY
jgi:uncharacterized OsmC-like protein